MLSVDNLRSIESEGKRLSRAVRRDPDRQVPQYPSWTLADLAGHTAAMHARTLVICRELPQERILAPPIPDATSSLDWFDETLLRMLEALSGADPAAPVWTLGAPSTLAFWERRMVVETGIHRWDADQALGLTTALTDHVARAGLHEFTAMWLPRLGPVQTLEVVAEDGMSWTYGEGEPATKVMGKASDLYLRLMARPAPAQLPADWAAAVDGLGEPPKP